MTDKDVEQPDELLHPPEPWWAGLGTPGAVTLIVLGALTAACTFLAPAAGLDWLPFTPEESASGYYQAAKVVAIGLILLGTTLLSRRNRTSAAEKPEKPQRD